MSVKRFNDLNKVDFPAPDAPIMPIIIGLATSNETSFTAVLFPNTLVTFESFSTTAPEV